MAKGNDFVKNPGGPSAGGASGSNGKGTDFTRSPGGPGTGGIAAKPYMPKQESYPKPDPDVPIPEGGATPFKAPIFSSPGFGDRTMAETPPNTKSIPQGPKPYKGLKG